MSTVIPAAAPSAAPTGPEPAAAAPPATAPPTALAALPTCARARLTPLSSRATWGLPVWGSSPVWRTKGAASFPDSALAD
eukprot:scaffold30848_cov51-Phaeocystis_antarctica.AAC.2